MKKKVTIFCVNYNSYDALVEYLASIDVAYRNATEQVDLSVIVADNSTNKESINIDYLFETKIIYSESNNGYFGGIEYGICNSSIVLKSCDFIIFSNVDVKVQKDFFLLLCSEEINNDIGCIAPCIYSIQAGRDRNPKIINRPGKNKLLLQRTLYQFAFLDYIYTHIFYNRRRRKLQHYPAGFIYAAHGSFMIFTSAFAFFLESMHYPCFLFGEEIYIAEQLKRYGLKTYYNPKLRVIDADHVSTRNLKKRLYYRYNYESINMLLKEFFV